ncbi:MAG: lysophospholipid acyltransferase family protein [Armatimonadetes bacterium]|nr:lysophospholipid acyltransferase family protein [Armatimonadota bacterium]
MAVRSMGSFGKQALKTAGGTVLRRLEASLSRKPPAKVEAFGEGLGRLLFRVGKKRRLRAVSNLGLAFPSMPEPDRLALAKRVFEHFGRTSADFLTSRNRDLPALLTTLDVVGRENLDQALEEKKGVLLVTGHFGNWERCSAWIALSGYPISVVVRDADQEGVNQLVNELRTKPGTRVISRGDAARPIIQRLRANELIGIVPDQNAEDIYLPFFGKMAGTNLGVGVIQDRTQSPVVPMACVYTGPNHYRLTFYPQLQPEEGHERKGEGLLRSINTWLEGVINEHPEQWLWFHDRWRNAREAGLL